MGTKKTPGKKAAAKKAMPKKAETKKAGPKTLEAKTAPAKKVATKKTPPKKAEAKKVPTKKASAKKSPSREPVARSAPATGSKAPDFALPADDGTTVRMSEQRGKNVVLYFYPKDMTPGCTIEAQRFRDAADALDARNAIVFGVSRDSIASHCKFKAKENLPFKLLSDTSGDVIAAYGSWGEKTMAGKKYMGILRTTVLVDAKGKVRKVYPSVKPLEHVDEVLADLGNMR